MLTPILWSTAESDTHAQALSRPQNVDAAGPVARKIVEDIRANGDEAVRRYAQKLDGYAPESFRVSLEQIKQAGRMLSSQDAEAIKSAADAIRRFHIQQGYREYSVETWTGVTASRRTTPIDVAALYIPGGSAPLVSTLLMLAIPAQLAGVGKIVVATPPSSDGVINPTILAAANLIGVNEIYAIGGAQAIAALAFGCSDLPKSDKVFGPGNAYVAAAKSYVSSLPGACAIDLPAGPSEVMVVADETSDITFVASDLLSQAEHDVDAQAMLICFAQETRQKIEFEVERQLSDLPRSDIARKAMENSRAFICQNSDDALEVINTYAPEHLILQLENPDLLLPKIRNAGSVFVGPWAPEAAGDYAAGPNHTLPTSGAARAWGGVTVESFQKTMTVLKATPEGAAKMAPVVERLAELEGLDAHKNAMALRRIKANKLKLVQVEAPIRAATKRRQTAETDITVSVNLDQSASCLVNTGIGFLDHMLEQISRHADIALQVSAEGDLEIDAHHTIEDICLTLGEVLREALGDKRGIERFGFELPMDECRAGVWIDLSGRPFAKFTGNIPGEKVGDFPVEMTAHAFRSLAESMRAAIHVTVEGENAHHMIEACFKAFGRALGQAAKKQGNALPSTKEFLE